MRWLRWLLNWPKPPELTLLGDERRGEATEECEVRWRDEINVARMVAYQQGVAVGECRGRLALAKEIEAEFQSKPLTEEDAGRIVVKQVH